MHLLKKLSWIGVLLISLLMSCENYDFNKMTGMWQLKSVQHADGSIQVVDTAFYSFQRNEFFTYTCVSPQIDIATASVILYGYIDFPAESQLHILMDAQYDYPETRDLLPWKAIEVTYYIVKQTGKELVLKQDEILYYFIKF